MVQGSGFRYGSGFSLFLGFNVQGSGFGSRSRFWFRVQGSGVCGCCTGCKRSGFEGIGWFRFHWSARGVSGIFSTLNPKPKASPIGDDREIGTVLPTKRRQHRTCYALCHKLYPVSAAHISIFLMDSNSTSFQVTTESKVLMDHFESSTDDTLQVYLTQCIN